MSELDVKPRSRDVTDGIEKAAARGMLRAVGMGDEDWDKPQIGIASSWNEITPCNLSLDRLAQGAKEGVHSGGGYPLQFGTISVSDGISMGHEGMHFSLVSREVIADSVETVMMAERLDGSVLLAGCDKSLPGMLMAAARLDLASVFLYAGSIAPGWVKLTDGTEKEVTIIDAFEAVGACKAGTMSEEDLKRIECAIAPGEGACGGNGLERFQHPARQKPRSHRTQHGQTDQRNDRHLQQERQQIGLALDRDFDVVGNNTRVIDGNYQRLLGGIATVRIEPVVRHITDEKHHQRQQCTTAQNHQQRIPKRQARAGSEALLAVAERRKQLNHR